MRVCLLVLMIAMTVGCSDKSHMPKIGEWSAVMETMDEKKLPFLLTIRADESITIYNGEETIEVDEITYKNDSIIIQMPVFEGVLKGKFTQDSISGVFVKPSLNRVVPFVMKQGLSERFIVTSAPKADVQGVWETVFSPSNKEDRYIAKGIFDQKGHKVTGTFRTTTGDYRYLSGAVENDSLFLSTFDGAHAFLFEAKIEGDSVMDGMFYSGNHFKEPFTAKRNPNYELPKADSLTFLKEGYDKIEFSFPNTKGEVVSLEDDKFEDQVVIVQIMGTWCPNCLDETKYYTNYAKTSKPKNVEFISLAFEYAPTKEKAMASINRLKEKVDVPYPILLAQYGSSDKKKANEKLPMLNHVLSYPTTIFIDKAGRVRKIHTGFNGPATGEKYDQFVKEFESYVQMLSDEVIPEVAETE
ncbi:MAG: TlpA family protein disulfide reductase [Flavobacteriaceae bacterium]|nr:TlpA family protein disulfide reductase [Flavobacteriaceae bacterium]